MIRETGEDPKENIRDLERRKFLEAVERDLNRNRRITKQKTYEAQQLVYDAWQAATDDDARDLMAQALKLDSTNIDALMQTAVYVGADGDQEIDLLRKIVGIGEKNLGPKMFKECAGSFWGFHETRPYMRARQRLAEVLRVAGRMDESVAEYQGMLVLNPGDNQGVRYSLLPSLLMLKRLEEARALFEAYPGDVKFNAVFAWARVLERFLSGNLPEAAAALAAAREQNPAVQAYVQGDRKVPRELPEAYAPGSREEAICFADILRSLWEEFPAALKWLETQNGK